MPQDSYIQVAPNSSGSKIAMDQQVDAASRTVLVQRAILTGETGDLLRALLETQQTILLTLQTMLANDQQFYAVLGTFGVTTPPVVTTDDLRQ